MKHALDYWKQALLLLPHDDPNRPDLLCNLGIGRSNLYARTGDLADLEAAIGTLQQAVEFAMPEAPNLPKYLTSLGTGLRFRYERIGTLVDLEAALSVYQQALPISDDLTRPTLLHNLGTGWRDRYAHTGEQADLDAAIQAYQQALESILPNTSNRPIWLSDLGVGLLNRYSRSGVLDVLEAAISALQDAVNGSPPGAPHRPFLLSNLGMGLGTRYGRTRNPADLDASISDFQQAVGLSPPDAPARPAWLSNLGLGLYNRYRRKGELSDLEAATTAFQQAVDTAPHGVPDRPSWLTNLGMGLSARYAHTKTLADLDASIRAYQQAVDISPRGSPDRPTLLSNLGTGLNNRYGRTGMLTDLNEAIRIYQQAVTITQSDTPDRPRHLSNLGAGLNARYARTKTLSDLKATLGAWEAAWTSRYARFVALPVLYQLGQQRQSSSLVAGLVMTLLELALRSRLRRQTSLRHALEVAEASKSRLLTQIVGRGPLPPPPTLTLQTAEREQHLLNDLALLDTYDLANYDQPPTNGDGNPGLDRLQQRQHLIQELDDLWTHIARLGAEGAEYVAVRRGEALTWQDMTRLARALGPTTALLSIFMVPERMFLIILRAGWRMPHVVEVPLTQQNTSDLLERFFREVHRYQPGFQRGETWGQVFQPLLEQARLHLIGVDRLILAPVGPGHLLPWAVLTERAGWRSPTGQPIALVTQPALGILPRVRQRPRNTSGPVLVVGNPINDLPHSEAEAKEVGQRFDTPVLLGPKATKAAVLDKLSEASLIHFATHAFFDAKDPLDSGIILSDGLLTAREVLRYRLQADLLVLSACQSGQVGSLGGGELAGLSQTFLQAGVRSLLVSLWSVNDPATAALMQAFYDARGHGADKAQALRQAMTQIQQDPRWQHSYYWGAFVLMGDWE